MLLPLFLCALIAPLALSYPTKRTEDIDVTVLQFALTLEHLENVFYKQALSTLTQQHFTEAGFGANYLNNLALIAADEDSHVTFLTTALSAAGVAPVAECTYNFAITDVVSFITLSAILEGVGTSAYLGAAPLLTNKDFLTAAGSILVTEALHTSLQRSAIKAAAGPNPFGTPLGPTAVFTLAASFIVSCPAENAPLPFTAFPSLSVSSPAACFCEGPDCSPSFFSKRKRDHPEGAAPSSMPSEAPAAMYTATATVSTYEPPAKTAEAKVCKAKVAGAEACRPPSPGTPASFTAASAVAPGSFLTFVSGLTVVSVAGEISDTTISAAIPQGVSGQTYVMVTSSDAGAAGKVDDATVLFGPAILEVHPSPPSIAPPAVRRR